MYLSKEVHIQTYVRVSDSTHPRWMIGHIRSGVFKRFWFVLKNLYAENYKIINQNVYYRVKKLSTLDFNSFNEKNLINILV